MYFLLTESPQGDDRVSVQLCYRRVCEFWESKDKIKDWDMKDYTLGTRSEASELRLDVDLGLKISAQDQKRAKREQKSSVRLINTNNKCVTIQRYTLPVITLDSYHCFNTSDF